MAHIAFINIPAYGHINPTLTVVEELLRRGHRVTYASTDQYAARIGATGAELLRYESTLTPYFQPGQAVDLDPERFGWSPVLFLLECAAVLPLFTAHFVDDPPDVLVYDMLMKPAGQVLGRKLGIPAVRSSVVLASNEHFSHTDAMLRLAGVAPDHPAHGEFAVRAAKFLAEQGMPEMPVAWLSDASAEATLAFLPKSFQPRAETFDDSFDFVGMCSADRDTGPDWLPPAGDPPLALVAFGTMSGPRPALLRSCVDSFAGTAWHAVLATGPAFDPDELGPLPPNVEAHQWIAQSALLRHTCVFVTHGGMGSVMQSLALGVPMVCVPHHPDGRLTAERVAELGLGRLASIDEVLAGELFDQVQEVARNEAIRRRVHRMSHEVHAAGGPGRAADVILARAGVRS